MYWVEYDPPPTFQAEGAAWLVSSDSDGHDRYRVPTLLKSYVGAFVVAGGKVVISRLAVLVGYDAASGAASWSLDLSGTYRDGYAQVQGIADLGNGKLAIAMYDYNVASGLYVIDHATGAIVWSTVGRADADYRVQGSDGSGRALVNANDTSSYSQEQGYHTAVDLFEVDSTGHELWRHRIIDGGALLAWSSGAPWLKAAVHDLSPASDYVAAPSNWFAAVDGGDFAFAFEFGPTANTPNLVNVIRKGAVIATGALAGTNAYDGTAVFPFVAGDAGDHLILLSQTWHGSPGLCHPSVAGAAALSRFDALSSYQCPLAFEGESGIEGAVLLKDRVILGRRTYLTRACTHDVQPVTIEAYGIPGESLATSGWVQRGGSRGLGMRPRR